MNCSCTTHVYDGYGKKSIPIPQFLRSRERLLQSFRVLNRSDEVEKTCGRDEAYERYRNGIDMIIATCQCEAR